MRHLPIALLLAAVYCLALGSVHPVDVGTGVLIGLLTMWALGLSGTVSPGDWVRRALAFPAFALAVAGEVASGTVQVGAVVLGLREAPTPGVVAVPIEERTSLGVAVAALTLTLSPGEVLVDVDWEGRRMLIHTIDATDPDQLRARHRHLYERYQRRVFP